MMLVGAFLSGINVIFLARDSGVLMKGIGLGMIPALIVPEAQMAQLVGGILQQVGLVIVVMLPIVCVRHRGIPHQFASSSPTALGEPTIPRQVNPAQVAR